MFTINLLSQSWAPKNALSKYEEALKMKLDSPELQKHLIDTGRKLANAYQSRSDTQKRDKIIQLVEPLDSNFKQSLEDKCWWVS